MIICKNNMILNKILKFTSNLELGFQFETNESYKQEQTMTMARRLGQSGGSPAESTTAVVGGPAATERGCVGGAPRLGTG